MPATDKQIADAITAATAAHHAAAEKEYDRWGRKDGGSCGNAILAYNGGSRFAKALIAAGIGAHRDYGNKGPVTLQLRLPEGIQTQCADVYQAAVRAFKVTAQAHGFEPTEFRTYVD